MPSPVRSDSARMRAEHLRQLRARHHAVLHVVVRRDAPHRGERRLAPLPDARALLLVWRHLDDGRARSAGRSPRRSRTARALRPPARRARRSASCRPAGKFGCTAASAASMRQRVHHLDRRRDDARRDDLRHRGARVADACRRRPAASARVSGLRRIRTTTLVTTASVPSLPTISAEQIGPGRVGAAGCRCAPARRRAAPPRPRGRGAP